MFRQLGEIGFEDVDAVLLERLMENREGAEAWQLLNLTVPPQQGGGNPLRIGETEKKSGAKAPAVGGRVVGHPFPPTIGRSIVTARRTRRPTSAVIIDLAMYRAQRRASLGLGEHHVSPFTM